MVSTRVMFPTALLVVTVAVWAAPPALAEKTEKAVADKAAGNKPAGDKSAALDPSKLVGTYNLVGGKVAGKDLDEAAKKDVYTFTPDTITIRRGDKVVFEIKYTLDTSTNPAHIDMTTVKAPYPNAEGTKALGIIAFDGDTLKLSYDPRGGDRPKSFAGEKNFAYELRRASETGGSHDKGAGEKGGDHAESAPRG